MLHFMKNGHEQNTLKSPTFTQFIFIWYSDDNYDGNYRDCRRVV